MFARCLSRIGGAAAALALATLGGCSIDDELDRQAVDGMVIFGDAPLAQGSIQFQAEETDQKKAALYVGAPINQGQFILSRSEGLTPGRYKVRIYTGPVPVADTNEGDATPKKPVKFKFKELIPPRYNDESSLTAEIKPSYFNSLTFVLER